MGLDVSARGDNGRTLLTFFFEGLRRNAQQQIIAPRPVTVLQTHQFFLSHGVYDNITDSSSDQGSFGWDMNHHFLDLRALGGLLVSNVEVCESLLKHLDFFSNFQQWTPAQKMDFIIKPVEDFVGGKGFDPAAFRRIFQPDGRLTVNDLQRENTKPILHCLCEQYFYKLIALDFWTDRTMAPLFKQAWELVHSMLQELISFVALTHDDFCDKYYGRSPLFCGLNEWLRITLKAFWFFDVTNPSQWLPKTTRYWLKDLQSWGIDLEKYGEAEKKAYGWFAPRLFCEDWEVVVDFKYGPRPEDWVFVFDFGTERFAGDFWEMIENPQLRIPGAWVE